MSGRIQPFVVSFTIGLLFPAVFAAGVTFTPALLVVLLAALLWVARIMERSGEALVLPIIGLVIGILAAVLLSPFNAGDVTALWILLFVLFS